ncbi:MAG: 4'-phosphopantetheinyl transferase superfamily protein [Candidatus Riflebacteria bacterium]|nr:4'-phosphopantetheinyl transferase superfamily protein [Candidatus Riflebacteria bacterium]
MKLALGEIHIHKLPKGDHYSDLRKILGRYLNADPREIEIVRDEMGKPHLGGAHASKLEFNLTHTEAKLLIAVAKEPVGVDMESLQRKIDYELILRRYFTESERHDFIESVQSVNADKREVFIKGWTRKEAILKAVGTGLSGMKEYLISFNQMNAGKYLNTDNYSLTDFSPEEGYWASVSLKRESIGKVTIFDGIQ